MLLLAGPIRMKRNLLGKGTSNRLSRSRPSDRRTNAMIGSARKLTGPTITHVASASVELNIYYVWTHASSAKKFTLLCVNWLKRSLESDTHTQKHSDIWAIKVLWPHIMHTYGIQQCKLICYNQHFLRIILITPWGMQLRILLGESPLFTMRHATKDTAGWESLIYHEACRWGEFCWVSVCPIFTFRHTAEDTAVWVFAPVERYLVMVTVNDGCCDVFTKTHMWLRL